MWPALALLVAVSLGAVDGGVWLATPEPEPPPPPPRNGGFLVLSVGVQGSLPSTGLATYREWSGHLPTLFDTGVGRRTTPLFAVPLLLDLEVGVALPPPMRVALEVVPVRQAVAHFGVDLARLDEVTPRRTRALTLWLGAGYEHLYLVEDGTHLHGPVSSARLTAELTWGWFILRPELFVRLQYVFQYDEENGGEGQYRSFPVPVPTLQLGAKLGVGLTWPR